MDLSQIRMGRDDRAVLVGQTGCGKTTVAERLLNDPDKRYAVVFDPKASDNVAKWATGGWTRYTNFSDLVDAVEDRDEPRVIFTPDALYAEDEGLQQELFYWVYARGRTRLYIDEATSLAGGAYPSRYLIALLNRGRERGISTLTATQRPARIPQNIISEAQHFYVFKLLLHADRKRVEELTGIPIEQQATLNRYEYFYWNDMTGAYHKKLILSRELIYA